MLPIVPENSVVTTWQQPVAIPQQLSYRPGLVDWLTRELYIAQTGMVHLRTVNQQLQQDAICRRQESEELRARHWEVAEHNVNLLGQNSRLKEQLRAARSKRIGVKVRRQGEGSSLSTSTGSGASSTVCEAGVDGIREEGDVKQEPNAPPA
ncbi:hypothetical protein AK830_g5495 [Neonectria ditissima]|uniref:Uncharacterized protein n=1 Tax=Neonectria ditissima TaxID=78410 RepID=A0A0N8H789_9HYPO|nr:hypothetical protein AK830_g5495 [Neonectria ditissima]